MKRSAPTRLSQVGQLRRAAKVGDAASSAVQAVLKPAKALGFPYRKPTVRRLGFTPASTMDDAFEIASDVVGRNATITHLHAPALLVADVH